ncbi:MAG: M48 family metalloprotease [Candidatus Diapherotrites archaeon]|nr:M48 family metalloprotease [Candidatus Diapherotrites archaeon]
MTSELSCIATCIASQNPVIAFLNYILIGIIGISAFALIVFGRHFSLKTNFLLKSAFLTSLFLFLIVLLFATPASANSLFVYTHTSLLLLIVGYFAFSYLFAPFIMRIGLKRTANAEVEGIITEESKNLNIKKPSIFVFADSQASAFTVSGIKKAVFISTALVERLNKDELKAVLTHELLHLKGNFFNLKRFFSSVRAGFFGLIPIQVEELDILAEDKIDESMPGEKQALDRAREKL